MGWVGATAVQIAEAVAAGRASAVAVVREHLDHLDQADGRLGAFVLVRRDAALAEAAEVDAAPAGERAAMALAGVPVAIKDVADVAGVPTRNGSRAYPDGPAAEDDVVVARLRAAGAVVVGKTRCPELCVFGTTDTPAGTSRNPWDPSRTPGGSSGGSAAAVGGAMVPLALASDGMGSIRIPAACVGLLGIKPGPGTVPMPAAGAEGHWFGLSQYGPLATTVADGARFLDVLAGGGGHGPLADASPPTGSLRIGVSTRAMIPGTVVAAPWREATEATARRLAGAGHEVVRQRIPMTTRDAAAMVSRWTNGVGHDIEALGLDPGLLEARVRTHAAVGRALRRVVPVREQQARRWQAKVAEMFEGIDVLLTPALLRTPPRADGWHERSWLANVLANTRYASMCGPWNLAGVPAASVPVGVAPDGLPTAVQVVAARGREDLVLAVAAQLEALQPWPRHAPTAVPAAAGAPGTAARSSRGG